ncbi:glyoxalase [Allokutzneria sp. NRRL B-24872]|uniref:glyoxalase n=1 Tax=Allokutzneria sp. NRRL B-24872 TaxID=1137961 RepID=UPI000A39B24D|nr:glyoxalase [Allokutzneria sp. NRRL B-24872]
MPDGVLANETTVPLLSCVHPDETLAFWRALGFKTIYEQTKPYLYLAFRWSGFDIHYGRASDSVDPAAENTGGCLVMVDDVAAYHATFVAAMREVYGKVLAKGLPRITRYRAGASRFTIVDPSGNSIIFIQRDEPMELEYGGSKKLAGLAKAMDNARILREFKNDDRAAQRALRSGLKRQSDSATTQERAQALAMLIEVSVALDDEVADWGAQLRELVLTEAEQVEVRGSVANPALLDVWLSGG